MAGPCPDLFGAAPADAALSDSERAAIAAAERLVQVLEDCDPDGSSFACVARIGAAEAQRRLPATPLEGVDTDLLMEEPYEFAFEESATIVGVAEVPGGCVVTRWGYFEAGNGAGAIRRALIRCRRRSTHPATCSSGIRAATSQRRSAR